MQFSQVLVILSIAASSTLAAPQLNAELSKRTCWELTGTALSVCQEACTAACEAATAGLAKSLCAKACDASSAKREIAAPGVRQIEARGDATAATGAASASASASASATAMMAVQVTDIDAVTFPKVDASAGRDACVLACEVTCNSTVLALIQSTCLSKCKALCPAS